MVSDGGCAACLGWEGTDKRESEGRGGKVTSLVKLAGDVVIILEEFRQGELDPALRRPR